MEGDFGIRYGGLERLIIGIGDGIAEVATTVRGKGLGRGIVGSLDRINAVKDMLRKATEI